MEQKGRIKEISIDEVQIGMELADVIDLHGHLLKRNGDHSKYREDPSDEKSWY